MIVFSSRLFFHIKKIRINLYNFEPKLEAFAPFIKKFAPKISKSEPSFLKFAPIHSERGAKKSSELDL